MAAVQPKEWRLKSSPPENFMRTLHDLPPLVRQLLWTRGITDQKAVATLLNPDYARHTFDPFLFHHMERAVKRIQKAIFEKEQIVVFGDYDADGVCGAAILHEFLREVAALHDVFIPDRSKEHFGLSIKKIKDFYASGAKLLVTVDCGVTDYDEIELANSLGIDVIILDHHVVPPRWPNAFAIIDHKHPDETYPEHVLSGAGLAFKVVQALVKSGEFGISPGWEKWLLELVAIAAIADMVPLTGENRTLVTYGLKVLRKTKRLGLLSLMQLLGINPEEATIETISHGIAPRINAASRMDHANTAFSLLTTKHKAEAEWLSRRLNEKNEERKKMVAAIFEELRSKIESRQPASIIFEGSTEWPAGVLGLVASRLVETYQRPVFLYAANDELVKGSCRAPQGMNVVELMSKAGEMFSDFGGHTLSGGFAALPENLPRLKEKLESIGQEFDFTKTPAILEIDVELSLDEAGEVTFELVRMLEPFGQGNPQPAFLIRGAKIADIRKVGLGGKHLKMKLGPRYIGAIYFGAGENGFRIGDFIDVVAEMQENIWNGSKNIELRIIDARHSQ